MTIDREAEALLQKLNVAVKAANEAETEFTSRAKTVGLLLLEAKKLYPAVKDFKAFLNQVDGLHLSRAYDYMRLAGGRTTDTELKKDARDRQRKSRGKKKLPKPSPSVTSRKSDEISIEQRRADHAALDMTAEEKAEASKWALSDFVAACLKLLPQMTEADQHEALKIVTEMTVKPKAEAA